MGRLINIAGNKYHRLTVLHVIKGNSWVCRCDCGKEINTKAYDLKSGHTKSCGCLKSELSSQRFMKHGALKAYKRTKEYLIWANMKNRCANPTQASYKNYGARGIKVCARWNRFENFISDMGKRPSDKHSLDRIDNNGNYAPSNCRWATKEEQVANKRPRIDAILYEGKSVTQWAKELNIAKYIIYARLKRHNTVHSPKEIDHVNIKL
jgi:hypothetical protein